MHPPPIIHSDAPTETDYAPSSERDRFLRALDGEDPAVTVTLARHLTGCGNPLPSSTCLSLGLPVGSSYGSAARHVIRASETSPAVALALD
jgi:hypothetical protein